MSVKIILEKMLALLQAQVKAVVAGDHEAVRAGTGQYEQLMGELEHAEFDVPREELQGVYDQIQLEKAKLQSLLSVEVNRIDFMLRLLMGAGSKKAVGYPDKAKSKTESGSRLLNRRA